MKTWICCVPQKGTSSEVHWAQSRHHPNNSDWPFVGRRSHSHWQGTFFVPSPIPLTKRAALRNAETWTGYQDTDYPDGLIHKQSLDYLCLRVQSSGKTWIETLIVDAKWRPTSVWFLCRTSKGNRPYARLILKKNKLCFVSKICPQCRIFFCVEISCLLFQQVIFDSCGHHYDFTPETYTFCLQSFLHGTIKPLYEDVSSFLDVTSFICCIEAIRLFWEKL